MCNPILGPTSRLGALGRTARRLNRAVEDSLGKAYGPRLYGPPLPSGLLSFADAPWAVLRNRHDWGVELGWWAQAFMNTFVARRIEEGLRTGTFRAGIVHPGTGELFWAPDGTWRLAYRGWGLGATAVGRAVRAGPDRAVRVPLGPGMTTSCIPFLFEHDLAACVGATTPPPTLVAFDLATIKEVPGVWPQVDQQRPDSVRSSGGSESGTGRFISEGAINGGALPIRPSVASEGDDSWKTLTTTHGFGGPPSSKHLIMREMTRRFASGLIEHGVTEEGRELHDWFKNAYPDLAPPTAKVISNFIRNDFKKLQPKARSTNA